MTKSYELAIHVFRRDLRLQDNTALIASLASAKEVIPCFIFDKRQIEQNDYKSENCIQFMVQSLKELDAELQKKNSQLYFFYGIAEEIITKLIQQLPIQAVFINRDYTPFSLQRDRAIEKICSAKNIDFISYADALLHEPEQILKPNHEPYTVFTHAFKRARQLPVAPPKRNAQANYYRQAISFSDTKTIQKLSRYANPNLLIKGGRSEGIQLIKKIATLTHYKEWRDIPAKNATTHLSAHHKFGTVSIRESFAMVEKIFGKEHNLITEFYWRDFFTHIAFHFPFVFDRAFHKKYEHITWENNEKYFRAWCEGRTGFPIVDAGMRELNLTGYMHNRVRMIVASFLTKDLHIDWRWGEKYFAQKLVDYDPAVNNGNWQWAASTGCDAQPYFRIFNPWLQQQKFDPDCLYIKKYIPELANISSSVIHSLAAHPPALMTNYPRPIIDHSKASTKAKLLYKNST